MRTWQKAALAVCGWEAAWWAVRRQQRLAMYCQAFELSRRVGKPLVVVGAPDRGATAGYPCGDYTIDIGPSNAPNFIQADISKPLPFADNSVVVFVACVLEYVEQYEASLAELQRIAGANLFVCRVEPWTLTAYLYPGAKRTIPANAGQPVPALVSP